MKKEALTFEELRELLSRPASNANWRVLWHRLKSVPERTLLEEYLPYVEAHLQTWPPGLRVAPGEARKLFHSAKEHEKNISQKRLQRTTLVDHIGFIDNINGVPHEDYEFLANNPICASLQDIHFDVGNMHIDTFEVIMASQQLTNIKKVAFNRLRLSQRHIDAIIQSPWANDVTHLTLEECRHPYASHEAFEKKAELLYELPKQCPLWPHLRELVFKPAVSIPDQINWYDVFDNIFEQYNTEQLASLDIHETWIDHTTPCDLLPKHTDKLPKQMYWSIGYSPGKDVPLWPTLGPYPTIEELHLSITFYAGGAESRAFVSIFHPEGCTQLRHLTAQRCELNDTTALALAKATHLTTLETLDLSHINWSNEALVQVLHAPHLSSLRKLHLRSLQQGKRPIDELLSAEPLKQLESLSISGWNIGNKDGKKLLDAEFPALRHLGVRYNKLNDEVLLGIADSDHFPLLETMTCLSNNVSYHAIFRLLTTPYRSHTFRRHMLEQVLSEFDKDDLAALLTLFRPHLPSQLAKADQIEWLLDSIHEEEDLLDLLFSEIFQKKQTGTSIKATLKSAGLKGYSRFTIDQLRTTFTDNRHTIRETMLQQKQMRDEFYRQQQTK